MQTLKDNLSPEEREVDKVVKEALGRIAKIDKDIENYQNRGSLRLDYVPVGTIIQDSARREIDIRSLKSQKEQHIESAIVSSDRITNHLPENQKTTLRQNVLEQLRPLNIENAKEEIKSVQSKFTTKDAERNLDDLRKRVSINFEKSYDFSKFIPKDDIQKHNNKEINDLNR